MAGKISELAPQTAVATVLTDDIETRDVDDLTMAPTGTNKRMPWSEVIAFLKANGLNAAYVDVTGDTVTGKLTVSNTDTQSFTVQGTGSAVIQFLDGAAGIGLITATPARITHDHPTGYHRWIINGIEYFRVATTALTSDFQYRTTATAPVGASDLTRKDYVDTQRDTRVAKGGDTMSGLLTLSADPSSALHAATKQYVDNLIAGLSWKEGVRAATTVNGTISSAFANGSVIDGVTLVTNDRILLKNQTTTTENGIYTVNSAGSPTRANDANAIGELEQATVFVAEGTANADTSWVCTTNGAITPGTTGTAWAQFSSSGGSVPTVRTINTTAPIAGGGDLSADRTFSLNAAGVTNTHLATMPTLTVKGNNTGSTGAPLDLNASQVKTLLAITEADVANLVTDLGNKQPLDADLTAIAALTATTGNMILSAGSAWTSANPATVKTALALNNVDNTTDANKPVSTAQATADGLKADKTTTVTGTGALGGGGDLSAARTITLNTDGVTNTFLANMPTLTIKGNNTGVSADPIDLSVAQTKTMLAITNGDVSGLGALAVKSTIVTADITNDAVDNTKLANMSANSFKGNNTGSVADPIDMTVAQAKTLLAYTPTDLGLVIGTNVQAYDADLAAIAGLTATTDNMIQSVGSTWASRTPAQVKTALALDQVNNTSDANKPVSTAQATADALAVPKTGGTMTGALYIQPPAQGNDALRVVQGQVTAGSTADFNLTGAGSVSVPTPTAIAHATRKDYVDTKATTVFTVSVNGAVPAPTTATGKFLKDDGTWATAGGGGSAASETVAGIAEIATTAEVTTGTDDTRIVSPLKLKQYVDSRANALDWTGTQATFDALATVDPNTIYYVTP